MEPVPGGQGVRLRGGNPSLRGSEAGQEKMGASSGALKGEEEFVGQTAGAEHLGREPMKDTAPPLGSRPPWAAVAGSQEIRGGLGLTSE